MKLIPFLSLIGAASFTIYNGTKENLHNRNYLGRARLLDVAGSGALGGALAGAAISFGSARESVFLFLFRFITREQHLNLSRYAFSCTVKYVPQYSSSGPTTT